MEPLRPKMDASARVSSQGSRNLGAYGDSMMEGHATGPGQRTRNDFGFGRLPNQATIPQAKASSRIPQVFSHRRGSNEQSDRPPLTHRSQSHSQSWALMSGANPGRSITHPVVSPASGMLQPVSASPRPRQVLRRKQSSISQDTASTRNGSGNGSGNGSNRASSSCSDPRSQTSVETTMFEARYDRGLTESPMEIRIAQKVELPKTTAQTVTIYPELDRYRDIKPPTPSDAWENDGPYRIATHDLPPPTPLFSEISTFSGSPSTRFSESPGPGPYSRDTTPTSISSQSPGLVAPARLPATRVRQASGETQARAHITRRRAGSISNEGDALGADLYGLAVVRESLTSSSSNSTVRDAEKKDKAKRKKKRLSPLPPSPPPRKSSQKFHKSRDEEESPSKASRAPTQPVLRASPTVKATSSSHVRQPSLPTQPSHGVASKTVPPVRPSRDGTPDLQSQFELPVPIIHSNLSTSSLSERRYSQTVAPASLHRSVTPSSSQDRPQPPTQLPLGREPTPAPRRGASYDSQVSTKPEGGRTTRTPSPGISTFKTRFPLFGRRTKTNAEEPQQDNKQKPTRKGPAAGTGHEGYGRLGAARRRSSSAARGANGTLPSQESLNSGQFYDPFLADRMAPVVIAGGEIVENRNTSSELSRTDSNLSVPFSRPTDSRNNSQVSLSSREGARRTLWPSAFPRDSSQAPSIRSRRPSDSSDSEALAMKSTLAYRRSVQRMKATDQQMPRVPKPIVTRPEVVSPAVTSIDESIMSDDSMFMPRTGPATSHQELEGADSPRPKKLTKRARSPRRWNFFGRSQSQSTSAPKKTAMEESARTVAATVKAVQQKPVAFYTIMDSSEQEDADTPNIQEVVREARAFEAPVQTERERRPSITQNPSTVRRPSIPRAASRERGPSLTQPSPRGRQTATMANGTPKTQLLSQRRSVTSPAVVPQQQLVVAQSQSTEQAPPTRQGTGRPSRLPQVGRIPKVVSARPEQTSPKSFSRPFHRISVQLEQPKLGPQDADSLAKGPSPPKPSTPELTQDESTITGGTSASESRLSNFREFSPEAGRVSKEFLSFSPRKNSLATMATTCSSCSGAFPYADATAVVPAPNEPLAEDEIWDEYNDLLGDENLLKAPPSVGVSVARIFRRGNLHVQLAAPVEAPVEAPMEAPLESPTISLDPPMESLDGTLLVAKMPTTSSIYSADMTDKIKESLEVGPHPSSPFSVTKFVVGYGDRNNSVDLGGKTASSPEQTHRTPAEPTRRSDASGSSQGSEDNSPLSQVNLRVGSMTVSKWLTFGHVLFSPVREELNEIVEGSLKRQSVLVIDGLGNDDWSFYAAETYPAATFFNLSPRAPLPADHRSSSTFPLSPANHHQVQYPTLSGKFPFGQESFTSVVFRFPVAAPEGHYRNIISEARRVLKPGGFIELSILDVDLNNMGNHGRRAVRRLKERIHSKSSDVSLGSTSDLILRLLGRRGFVDIKTCRVGVPVATPVSRSSGSERSSTSGKIPTLETPKPKPKKEDRSLADMMSDESPVADENITKMVAKVGRWWYSRCYETAASAAPGATSKASLWNDRTLLAECQERGTSLKLMVCHARVPDGKGRLASI